jgi:hypothetical protein
VSFEATFVIWGNDTKNQTTTLDITVAEEVRYCLSPSNNTGVNVDAIISYGLAGYDTRNYFLDEDDMVTSTQQDIVLYLVGSGSTTEISITVTDASDIPLEDIVTEAWMYDMGTDTYSMVQSETTNAEGKLKMDLVQGNYFIFRFYRAGVLLDTTERFKLTETSLTFKIATIEEPLLPSVQINYLLTNFSWDLTTTNISFNFSGLNKISDLTDICWDVVNLTMQEVSTLYTSCFGSSSDTGLDSYIISASEGYFRAFAYVFIKGARSIVNYYTIDMRDLADFGNLGWLMGLFVILTLGAFGLAIRNPSVTIMMTLFGFIINVTTQLWILGWDITMFVIGIGLILMWVSKS